MKLRILPSALTDLGEYFLNSLFGDIDSLAHHVGSHRKVFGYHRLLAKRFPFAIYYKKEGDVCVIWRVLDCRQNPVKTIRALK